jgi:7SK snRNA methylphosphate capping enzyme
LKPEWLINKKILDVGCNNGTMDLIIAVKYHPKMIIGIDIDHKMIKNAITNMQKAINDSEQTDLLL